MTPETPPLLKVDTGDDETIEVTITAQGQTLSVALSPVVALAVGQRLLSLALPSPPATSCEFEGVAAKMQPRPGMTEGPRPEAPAVTVPPAYEEMLNGAGRRTSWRVTKSAQTRAEHLSISREAMVAAAADPERIDTLPDGEAVAHVRDGISVLVPRKDPDTIIGVTFDRRTAKAPQADSRRASSGGAGRKMPATFSELSTMLDEHGFTIHQGKGHPKVRHPDKPGRTVTIPRTPSDRRGYMNTVSTIRGEFDVDITRPQAST